MVVNGGRSRGKERREGGNGQTSFVGQHTTHTTHREERHTSRAPGLVLVDTGGCVERDRGLQRARPSGRAQERLIVVRSVCG